jgi:hypothetical protein
MPPPATASPRRCCPCVTRFCGHELAQPLLSFTTASCTSDLTAPSMSGRRSSALGPPVPPLPPTTIPGSRVAPLLRVGSERVSVLNGDHEQRRDEVVGLLSHVGLPLSAEPQPLPHRHTWHRGRRSCVAPMREGLAVTTTASSMGRRAKEREREEACGGELGGECERERRRAQELVLCARAPFRDVIVNGVVVCVLRWRHFCLLYCSFALFLRDPNRV